MKFGIALDFGSRTRLLPEQLDRYQPLLRAAEDHGLSTVWAGETYPTGPDHVPWFHASSSLMVLALLAGRTSLQLGTAVLLSPAWHPLRLAYDATLVDQVSHGRLVLGIGLGGEAVTRRFGGAPSHRVRHLEECVRALRCAGTGSSPPIGPDELTVWPPPFRPGGPPVLLGGGVRASAYRAAALADGYYVGSSSYALPRIRQLCRDYRDACRERERLPGTVAITRLTVVDTSDEDALSSARRFVGAALAEYAKAGSLGERDRAAMPSEIFARWATETALIGSPETVVRQVREYRDAGVDTLAFRLCPAGMPVPLALRTLKLLAEVVAPD